jgi:hypothetical protein
VPDQLGAYYLGKGDSAGANTPEGQMWYGKALAVLQPAADISRAKEQAFDADQLAHDRPLTKRLGNDVIYLDLAASYAHLGRDAEALEALNYERFLAPDSPRPYQAITLLDLRQSDFADAAVAADEQTLAAGADQDTMANLQNAYSRLPGGSCAVSIGQGKQELNLQCPAVAQNRCRALEELKDIFTQARKPERAAYFEQAAQSQMCPAPTH